MCTLSKSEQCSFIIHIRLCDNLVQSHKDKIITIRVIYNTYLQRNMSKENSEETESCINRTLNKGLM